MKTEIPLKTYLWRGAKKKCPACGEGELFGSWNNLHTVCPKCACELKARETDCWGFLYLTTAGLTGIFLIALLIVRPNSPQIARVILALTSFATIVLTVPNRKGMALGFEYWLDQRLEFPRHPTKKK